MRRALLLALACWSVAAAPALACGMLFPKTHGDLVNQAGEKLLFIQDGDELVTQLQLQYAGGARDFSWVVPVPTQPTVAVAKDAVFQALDQATAPVFDLDLGTSGTCKAGPASKGLSPTRSTGASGVTVVSQGEVGPYDTATLTADDPDALKQWLTTNGYAIPDKLDPLLAPYVADKYYFVALKLTNGATTGSIQPVSLRFKATKPGIPIRLASLAATDDLPLTVWILGDHRAIPENYRHAVINEARIDWLRGGQNYRQVVTAAMDEAGGQAFVTDYAGKASAVDTSGFDDDTRSLFGKHAYLTRLFTTMSPGEMTQDPTFMFNPDLPEVSNHHQATGVTQCSSDVTANAAPVLVKLADGTSFTTGSVNGNTQHALAMPAAARVEQLKTTGSASVIADNHAAIAKTLAAATGLLVFDPTTGAASTEARSSGSTAASTGFGCSGCAANNAASPPLSQGLGEGVTYALVAMGWWGYRRRTRRR